MADYLILILFDQHFNSQTLTLIALQLKPKLAKEATTRYLAFSLCLIIFLNIISIIGLFIVILIFSIL